MKTNQLKITYQKTGDLVPYARNSRTHSEEQVGQIAASIREFGFTNPVLVDEENTIIAGHGRIMAAQKLGLEDVPTITLTGLTETQRRAYVIADNSIAMNAGWDEEMLKKELRDLDDMGFDMDLLSMDGMEEEEEELEGSEKETKIPQAIQLEPDHEYAVVMCKDADEWEALKVALNLTPVRRGGYKKGSAFDAVGTQRVVKAGDLLARIGK
jgi:ParB-like chromosome segregation protein Spo0J